MKKIGKPHVSREGRSRIMRAIRSKDTKPELIVRRLAHKLGYRFRLHHSGLPGKPDLVFVSRRKAIFVHGCFWHSHQDRRCRNGQQPASNKSYWLPKLARTRQRDKAAITELRALGWASLVVWECQLDDKKSLAKNLREFLC